MREEFKEAQKRHGLGLAEHLRRRLHLVAAAVVAVILILQIAGVILGPSDRGIQAIGSGDKALADLGAAMASADFPRDERTAKVRSDIERMTDSLTYRRPGPSGLPAGMTYPIGFGKTVGTGESNEIKFAPPIDVKASAEAGGVDVVWAEPAGNNTQIARYEVLRSEAGGQAAAAGSVAGTVHLWRDTTAKPGVDYEYRVSAVASDTGLIGSSGGRATSEPVKIRAIADFRLELVDMKDGSAVIKVLKWHGGAWKDRVFTVAEGKSVGSKDEALGIDFGTGRVLAAIRSEQLESEQTRDEYVFDAQGRVVVEAGIAKRVSVTSNEPFTRISATISGGALPDETLTAEKR